MEELRQRSRRLQRIYLPAFALSLTVVGYFLLGVGGAIFFLVLALISSAISVFVERRYWGR